jgi:hypothetical protein
LAKVDAATCLEELRSSRERIENELGGSVDHLAYPHGSHDAGVVATARQLEYRSAFTVEPRPARPADDPLATPRIPINGGEGRLDFVARLATARSLGELGRAVRAGASSRLGLR